MVHPPIAVDTGHADRVKQAVGWLHTARFLTTAAQLHHLPAYDQPEIAFVGRSNAGKSTCINVLTQLLARQHRMHTWCGQSFFFFQAEDGIRDHSR